MRLPFSFAGVHLHEGRGAKALRVRLSAEGERIRLDAADQDGVAVATIEALSLREVDPAQLGSKEGASGESLFNLEWAQVQLPDSGESEVEVFECRSEPGADPIAATQLLCAQVLERLQAHLANEGAADSRLAFLTKGAMALDPSGGPRPRRRRGLGPDPLRPVRAPRALCRDRHRCQRGLQASAGGSPGDHRGAPAGSARGRGKGTAVGKGRAAGRPKPPELDPEATVLITGGLSGLGALTARHLAAHHGAKQLLLTSRRGPEAPGASELIAELAALGCEAKAVACDVSEREQVKELLAQVPAQAPLGMLVHCAGRLDDGVIEALDPERLEKVLAAKANGAWHLHEATRDIELSDFVLYSSVAASFGSPGQGNYAAANSFLDALAQKRRAEGLPATAIAWGMWEGAGGMTAQLSEADLARLARSGLGAIEPEQGLELFDRARCQAAPLALAVPLQSPRLKSLAAAGLLPPLLSGLVKVNRRRARAQSGSLARRLAQVPEPERKALVLELVREHAAAVLGHSSAQAIDPAANFKDLGFDSLGAVELRNRLAQAAGLQIEATLVFDHPSSEAVAGYLLEAVEGKVGAEVTCPRRPRQSTSRSRSSA